MRLHNRKYMVGIYALCGARSALLALIAIIAAVALSPLVSCPAAAQTAPDYRLGPEDVITVTVMRHVEFSGDFLIPTDGAVDLPRVGQVQLAGKTLAEAADLIVAGLRATLLNPEVSVTLKNPRRQYVYIAGAVQRPGPYDIKPGWRLTEAITAAGGIIQGIQPADCTVHIVRGAGTEGKPISLQQAMRGDTAANQLLETGDVITVESVELIPVYVMGKVRVPGLYSLRKESAGVLEAITMAGGPTEDAALTKVTVTHLSGESETMNIVPVTIEGKQESPIKLLSGDLLVVPESDARYAVLGWVNSPGIFPLAENHQITLADALGMAKGTDPRRGGIERIAILRTVDGKPEHLKVDFRKFSKDGDVSQNPEIKAGDIVWVPETGSIDWDRMLQRLSSGLSVMWAINRWGN